MPRSRSRSRERHRHRKGSRDRHSRRRHKSRTDDRRERRKRSRSRSDDRRRRRRSRSRSGDRSYWRNRRSRSPDRTFDRKRTSREDIPPPNVWRRSESLSPSRLDVITRVKSGAGDEPEVKPPSPSPASSSRSPSPVREEERERSASPVLVEDGDKIQSFMRELQETQIRASGLEDEEEDGPVPIGPAFLPGNISYGGNMAVGEAEKIAQFVQRGERVPRRGEVGWEGEEISQLENLGYVMSGSRHQVMNAVRLRKENQVYTAEEKRALALFNYEEQKQKEGELLGQFRDMVAEKLQSPP